MGWEKEKDEAAAVR